MSNETKDAWETPTILTRTIGGKKLKVVIREYRGGCDDAVCAVCRKILNSRSCEPVAEIHSDDGDDVNVCLPDQGWICADCLAAGPSGAVARANETAARLREKAQKLIDKAEAQERRAVVLKETLPAVYPADAEYVES